MKLKDIVELTDIKEFLDAALPPSWGGVKARIIESGAVLSKEKTPWIPRWSPIYMTKKSGPNEDIANIKSIIYRVHDCIHQLWGLPFPVDYSDDSKYYYKRSQMCGEIAVLTLTEFVYVKHLSEFLPELNQYFYHNRSLSLLDGPFLNRTVEQIATRLDTILHRKIEPQWVRDNPDAKKFVDDYVPMLEADRVMSDKNWELMKSLDLKFNSPPKSPIPKDLDGLELTLWMIKDFEHTLTMTEEIDVALMHFNRERRAKILIPAGWTS